MRMRARMPATSMSKSAPISSARGALRRSTISTATDVAAVGSGASAKGAPATMAKERRSTGSTSALDRSMWRPIVVSAASYTALRYSS